MFNYNERRSSMPVPRSWRLLLPAWISVAAVTILVGGIRAIGYDIPMTAQLLGYLIGLVAINLPHGGFENLQNLRTRTARFQALYALVFVAMVGAFVGLLIWNPVVGVGLMIAVACVKGGLGGLAVLDAVTGADHIQGRLQRWLGAAVRGGVVMLVPYLAFPETFKQYTGYMVEVFDGSLAAATYAFHPLSYQILPVAIALGAIGHIGLGYLRDPGTGTWVADAIETLLLIAFFAIVPVVLAVGLYFPLWYSARQVARSAAVDDDRPVADGAWMAADDKGEHFASVLNWSMFIIGGVFTGLLIAGLYVVAPEPVLAVTGDLGGWEAILAGGVVFYTIFVSIIALPHIVVGGMIDRQGIWFVP